MADLGSTTSRIGIIHFGTSLDANGTTVTAVECGYLSGVTSAIQTQLAAKATDSLVVHLAGTETITGSKTFGAGGTGSTGIVVKLDGGSATDTGAQLRFLRNSVLKATIGHYGSVFGGTSDNLAIYSPGNSIVLDCGGNDVLTASSTQILINAAIKFTTSSTGSTTALLATANCPATTGTAPYVWLQFISPDGSTVYVPGWK